MDNVAFPLLSQTLAQNAAYFLSKLDVFYCYLNVKCYILIHLPLLMNRSVFLNFLELDSTFKYVIWLKKT